MLLLQAVRVFGRLGTAQLRVGLFGELHQPGGMTMAQRFCLAAGDTWRIVRLGADIGVRCATCGRRVLIGRSDLERDIKRFVERGPLAPAD